MAGFFPRRSLAQDEVDRYITFAAILFLFLALVTLLMPLSPTLSSSSKPQSAEPVATSPQMSKPPKVKATCWAPAQFEDSQVDYTTTFCTGAANGVLNGIKPNGSLVPHSDFPLPPDASSRGIDVNMNLTSFDSTLKTFFETRDEHNAQLAENERIRERTRELVDFRTPIIFVLIALCLKLPYVLASLVGSVMTSGINIDQTLDSCVASRSLDIASQRQIHEETASAVADSLHRSKSTASSLFLFMKVLVVLVVLTETVFIGKYILPDIQDMEMSFEENLVTGSAGSMEKMDNESRKLFAYPNNVYHCSFILRQLHNVHDYSVQCVITYVDDSKAESRESITSRFSPPTVSPTKETLLLYQALFTIALAVLAFLLITTVINTISWFLRLFVKSYATFLGLPSNSARDVVLLAHMARLNAGQLVVRGLTGSSVWSNRFEETNKEPAMDTKA